MVLFVQLLLIKTRVEDNTSVAIMVDHCKEPAGLGIRIER
jgi:hypothetical protein